MFRTRKQRELVGWALAWSIPASMWAFNAWHLGEWLGLLILLGICAMIALIIVAAIRFVRWIEAGESE